VVKLLIDGEREILDQRNKENGNENDKGLLIVAGFSQGCGMSLHCLYETHKVDCVLGISGYFYVIYRFQIPLPHFQI